MTTAAPHLRSIMPCFLVPDVARTVAWYRDVLGFANGGVWGEEGECFGIADVGDGRGFHFKSGESGAAPRTGALTVETAKLDAYVRLDVNKVRPLHAALVRAGVRVLGEPVDQPWAQRELVVVDPDGHVLCFGGDLTGEWPADEVLAAPDLGVRDPEVTAAFFRDALGFPEPRLWGSPPGYLIARRDDAILHAHRAAPADVRSNASHEVWDAYVWCDGLDELAGEFQRRGVPLERTPVTTVYGMREFDVLDPDGHVICFGAPTRG